MDSHYVLLIGIIMLGKHGSEDTIDIRKLIKPFHTESSQGQITAVVMVENKSSSSLCCVKSLQSTLDPTDTI